MACAAPSNCMILLLHLPIFYFNTGFVVFSRHRISYGLFPLSLLHTVVTRKSFLSLIVYHPKGQTRQYGVPRDALMTLSPFYLRNCLSMRAWCCSKPQYGQEGFLSPPTFSRPQPYTGYLDSWQWWRGDRSSSPHATVLSMIGPLHHL